MASIIITKWPSSSVCRVGLGWELSDDQILQIPRLLICNPYPLTNNIIIIIIVNIIMIILGSRVIWKIFGSPDPWEGLVYLKWDFLTYSWTLWNTGCMETYLSEGSLQFKQHVQMDWVKYQSARITSPFSVFLKHGKLGVTKASGFNENFQIFWEIF